MIEIPVDRIVDEMRALAGRLQSQSLSGPLTACLQIIREGIAGNFSASAGSRGGWPMRKDDKPHPLLQEDGSLLAAATGKGPGAVAEVGDRELAVGVDKSVDVGGIRGAAVHNFGFGPIPQREYLWAPDDTLDRVAEVLADGVLSEIFGT